MQKFLLVCIAVTMFSCREDLRTREHGTRLNSKDYPDKTERLTVFNQFIGTHSAITDVEFDLFNVNGFGDDRSIPGASSRYYRYVVKVDPADVGAWCDFLHPLNLDTSGAWQNWQDSLVSLRKDQWGCQSAPQFYTAIPESFIEGKGLLVIVYRPEGIIFREVMVN